MNPLSKKGPLRVGIAGLGGIAKRTHLPILKLLPDYHVVCGAERDSYQRNRVAELFNIEEKYGDFIDMIDHAEIDAVFICLPATLHSKAVYASLDKGLHVFCEKPMGLNSDEASKMVNMAIKANRVLMPGYNLRYVDNFIRAKELIESGKLGKIIHVNALFMNPGPYISWDPKSEWYLKEESGGALYDVGSHIVDLLFYLFPHRIEELQAFACKGYEPYGAITNIVSSYRGEGGILGTIQIGWRSASEVCSLEFHGTAGTLFVSRRNFSYTHGATDPADRIAISTENVFREFKSIVRKLNLMRKGIDVLDEFIQQAIMFWTLTAGKKQNREDLQKSSLVHQVLEAIESSLSKDEKNLIN
ncbi:Gfo/Idh/MocA family protein [Thermodesulfobacteriota bacterium]